MRKLCTLSAAASLAVLSACAPGNPAATSAGPMSTASVGGAQQSPQSPGSFPAGGATTNPLSSPTGNIATTAVGPGTPGAYAPDGTQQPTQAAARRRPRARARS